MNIERLHPDVLDFATSLARLEDILTVNKQGFWAAKVARAQQLAEKSDGYAVDVFLELLGGMGSLNDLILDWSSATNDELHKEIERAYLLARALQKSL